MNCFTWLGLGRGLHDGGMIMVTIMRAGGMTDELLIQYSDAE